jgi:cold shock CspA family protein
MAMTGEVLFFMVQKDVAFIHRDDGRQDLYVHHSQLPDAGVATGDTVKFQELWWYNERGRQTQGWAQNVTIGGSGAGYHGGGGKGFAGNGVHEGGPRSGWGTKDQPRGKMVGTAAPAARARWSKVSAAARGARAARAPQRRQSQQ